MAAESHSAFLAGALPVPAASRIPTGYYRSRLFAAPHSGNPLIAAASPLFSMLERLGTTVSLPALPILRDNIEHELLAFHSRLVSLECPAELTAVARYLLCATIDELLAKNWLRVHGEEILFAAFSPVSQDTCGPEQQFFSIVRTIREHPTRYLDLVELAYFCLITGFEGEYRQHPNGKQALDNLIEDLYQLVRKHRVHQAHQLLREHIPAPETTHHSNKPVMAIVATVVGICIAAWTTSHLLLEHKAKAMLETHTVLSGQNY